MSKTSLSKNYLQERLARLFAEKISSGIWLPESRIPSIRQLAVEYEVSTASVAGAVKILQQKNLLSVRPNSGYFVTLPDLWQDDMLTEQTVADPLFERGDQVEFVLHFLFHLDSVLGTEFVKFYTSIICLMQEEAEAVNWQLRIGNAANIREIIANADGEYTRGVIYMPDQVNAMDLQWPELKFPKVLFSIGEKSLHSNYVTPDNYQGGCLAAEYMSQCSLRQIIVRGRSQQEHYLGERPYRERLQGYIDYCKLNDLPEPEVVELENLQALSRVFDPALQLPETERPGVVFLGDYFMIKQVETVFNELYPQQVFGQDVRILVFMDYQDHYSKNYVSIGFSKRQMCREVVALVRRVAQHPRETPIRVKIPMFLRSSENQGVD